MIFNYPYLNSSYYRRYPHYTYTHNSNVYKHNNNTVNYCEERKIKESEKKDSKEEKKEQKTEENRQCFQMLGIKLYFDDILLMCLIFFLYKEGIKDQNLFICLILLLLS